MCLLLSVHLIDEVPLRLYPSDVDAKADTSSWQPAECDSEFIGFRLLPFDPAGHPLPAQAKLFAN